MGRYMKTIEWKNGKVVLIDQRKLPTKFELVECFTCSDVVEAIKKMKIRGAPAIGVAASFGMSLAAFRSDATRFEDFLKDMETAKNSLAASRPTAVNLTWALNRIMNIICIKNSMDLNRIKASILKEAQNITREDIEINKTIGKYGASFIKDGDNILTHCNAGALATAGFGTALGVIRSAYYDGKKIHVFVDETRPFLQGARLTAWELMLEKIPFTLITDSMAGFIMSKNKIDLIVVGADRIAANGDIANKIGTYSLSILAKENNIPFYVAAPMSTIDVSLKYGNEIPIEERPSVEITHFLGNPVAPKGTKTYNPAFDITSNRHVTAIITEKGIIRKPYKKNIKELFST